MQLQFGAASDVGRKRPHNEDSFCADPTLGLFLVADGMGGHAAGEVASKTVTDAIREFITETQNDRDKTWPFAIDPELSYVGNRLRTAILVANRLLSRRILEDEELRGMATTLSAVLVVGKHVVVSNVGDCRAYLLRGGIIRQVTLDHSWVAEQVRAGLLSADAARAHPWRSMVTRAVSGTNELAIDILEFELQPRDRLLLCSDGLHGQVTDAEMMALVGRYNGDLEAACHALVEAANNNGGPDNITAILIALA
jgi:protein phosphatase